MTDSDLVAMDLTRPPKDHALLPTPASAFGWEGSELWLAGEEGEALGLDERGLGGSGSDWKTDLKKFMAAWEQGLEEEEGRETVVGGRKREDG